ncbi:MAG: hypothetical protein V3W34_19355 [Phycisphaerae bacterium]
MSETEQPKDASDPLIDEVRAVRKALSEQFGNDVDELGKYLRKIGDQYGQKSPRVDAPASPNVPPERP